MEVYALHNNQNRHPILTCFRHSVSPLEMSISPAWSVFYYLSGMNDGGVFFFPPFLLKV